VMMMLTYASHSYACLGFRLAVERAAVVVQLLMGEVREFESRVLVI
jgi:hypothetical protein